MSSVLKTSTMNSPPLDVCVAGSFTGDCVSAAIWRGPGREAFSFAGDGTGMAFAAGVAEIAAAPASVAPLRKLRRPIAGELSRRFDMGSLPVLRPFVRQRVPAWTIEAKCRAGFPASQAAEETT